MRVQCSTCLELLTPGDDLTCTPCGHVFHMACVVQWFETKKNCPQCRHSANERTLRKIFLSDTDVPQDQVVDADSLQNQLDGAKFQLRCKEGERVKLVERVRELEEQESKQRDEIKVLERSKQKLKEQGERYRTQARVLQEERFKYDEARKEAETLRQKLENYKGVELSLRGQEEQENNAGLGLGENGEPQTCEGKEKRDTLADKNVDLNDPRDVAESEKKDEGSQNSGPKIVLKIKSKENIEGNKTPVVKIKISATKSLKVVKFFYIKKLKLENMNLVLRSGGKVVGDDVLVGSIVGDTLWASRLSS